ncbi:glycosyl transferase [Aspergillus luchuensis]|uniref:Glycosyl transferase n=1 Tax=Aspergillus kawachii TaxID=1069201 RepID=A0A146F470_ASPKA|nr:glycosyl transferase [Aspergillus luchuensis]
MVTLYWVLVGFIGSMDRLGLSSSSPSEAVSPNTIQPRGARNLSSQKGK